MECNKEEALKALSIAQSKIQSNEWDAARRFASKAGILFSSVEVSQTSAIIDVLCAAERKIKGLPDWYGILQLDNKADEVVLKKQHKKLALLLHPDKNKIHGSDLAFNFVSEAYNVLSNKEKRFLYDETLKRSEPVQPSRKRPSTVSDGNMQAKASRNSSNPNNFQEKYKSFAQKQPPKATSNRMKRTNSEHASRENRVSPARGNEDTFWTACVHCHMQYEYSGIYKNKFLRCRSCNNAFLAVEAVPISVFCKGVDPVTASRPSVLEERNGILSDFVDKSSEDQNRIARPWTQMHFSKPNGALKEIIVLDEDAPDSNEQVNRPPDSHELEVTSPSAVCNVSGKNATAETPSLPMTATDCTKSRVCDERERNPFQTINNSSLYRTKTKHPSCKRPSPGISKNSVKLSKDLTAKHTKAMLAQAGRMLILKYFDSRKTNADLRSVGSVQRSRDAIGDEERFQNIVKSQELVQT